MCLLVQLVVSACTSPKNYTGLGQGGHTFGVQAKDTSGHASSAAYYSWAIDLTPPSLAVRFNMQTKDPFGNPSAPTTAITITFANTDGGLHNGRRLAGDDLDGCYDERSGNSEPWKQRGDDTLTATASSGFTSATLTAKK